MLLTILRAVFILLVASIGMNYANLLWESLPAEAILSISIGLAVFILGLDVFIPQKSLLAMSGVFFGLVVGLLIAFGAGLIIDLLVEASRPKIIDPKIVSTTKLLIGIISCYVAISFILQTKDDIRFVIPYVEFAKERKGQRPMILDTSTIIDGRIVEVLQTWPNDAPLIVPRFVLQELHAIADSSEKLKRNRGRRGLDIVNKLQSIENLDIQFQDVSMTREESLEPVDQRLVIVAGKIGGRIITNDYNLNKLAQIRGVEVINVNDLANALKPVFLPGESMVVKILKSGEEQGQGVGYLEDGTMVVVEAARERMGQTIPVIVTSMLQTSAGRMVFGRPENAPASDRTRRKSS
ncbi:MAG: PIN/TRAM domain-containing protein [Planctomycetota bacterium]|nr:MAG: PIN/TRAM domain-containing protein [Planctomycetota bacterium]